MALSVKTYEVTLGTTSLEVTANPTASNATELFPKAGIVSVIPLTPIPTKGVGNTDWTYPYDSICQIQIEFANGSTPLTMELASITNQSGWTPDLAGLQQAVADINAWI